MYIVHMKIMNTIKTKSKTPVDIYIPKHRKNTKCSIKCIDSHFIIVNPKCKVQIFQECIQQSKSDIEANNKREDVLDKHLS